MQVPYRSRIGSLIFWLSWPIWYFYLHNSQRIRVIIVSDNKVLFVRNLFGISKLALPGGGLHRNEDPRLGASREIREETGLFVNPEDLKLVVNNLQIRETGICYRGYCYAYHLPKIEELKPRSMELIDIAWLPWRELIKSNDLSKATGQILRIWIKIEHLLD